MLATRAAVRAIFHLSKIDGIRAAGHTYANDKILAITRDHCYATNFGAAGGAERKRGKSIFALRARERHSVGRETCCFPGDLLPPCPPSYYLSLSYISHVEVVVHVKEEKRKEKKKEERVVPAAKCFQSPRARIFIPR